MPPLRYQICSLILSQIAQAQLMVDFNSTTQNSGPHNEDGYQAFSAPHEGATAPLGQDYTAFGTTITVTPSWPNTSNNKVRQFVDRGLANDAQWGTTNLDLLTDWIGADARSGNGGNGTYDGNTGTPTYLTITLSGLPAGSYSWKSFHHDTENINAEFQVEYSVNQASSFTKLPQTYTITDSTAGGTPASPQTYSDTTHTKDTLPSTVHFDFMISSGQDIKIRLAPYSTGLVHQDFVIMNGFEVDFTAPPTGPTNLSASTTFVARTIPVGEIATTFTTSDPTPDDQFTYTLVDGEGDDNNRDFEISENQLITQNSLEVYPPNSTLSIRVRTTDLLGSFLEKSFTLQLQNDSDQDSLDDTWELTYFNDLSVASGLGNNDQDLLNNLSEQEAGTNPTNPDSDSDGLLDHVETNTGIYLSPTDTGSDPLNADSDRDGLSDSVEVGAENGFITNPNLADSDSDGYNDRIEIENGKNPNDQNDFPDVLFPIQISEIMVANETGTEDGNGSKQDWIELFNPNDTAVNLDAYYLTDEITAPKKWNFPSVVIPANGYLIVFASGNDQTDPSGNPHTNFRLSNKGEYLGLIMPNGLTVADEFSPAYPEQFSDISFGLSANGGAPVFFDNPTPGKANGAGAPGVVKDTNFSVDRGFYDNPFDLEITSDTQGATIRYTLDGSIPSLTNGLTYSGPISISGTSNIRAIAYLESQNYIPTNVDTHTYLFVDQVAQQSASPPGWPSDWGVDGEVGRIVPSDYEMDPRVVNDTLGLRGPGYTMREALLDIPSVSLTMKRTDFVKGESEKAGDSLSLYGTPRSRFERFCSVEYLLPDGTKGFQEDCKIETHGNSSRRPFRMQKHSLRLTFSSEIGVGKLNYNLFPESPVDEFNKLVLRACFTDSWALASWGSARYRPNDSLYMRDVWMKETFGAMGQQTSYGNFVHLYVNGVYFGLHNLTERVEDDFYAEHVGGEVDDWEVNSDLDTPGPLWRSMISTLNGPVNTEAGYAAAKEKIDVQNYADWLILHFFGDAEDWPEKNSYGAANSASGDGRYRFNVWDQEIVLDKFTWNRYNSTNTGTVPFQRLRLNDDFKALFADRVYKHMFDGGALTVEEANARFLKICNQIDKAIIAESARWGDTQANLPYGNTAGSSTNVDADYYPPTINNPIYFTREQHWLVERDNVLNHYIPTLHDQSDSRSFIRELRAQNLYPDIDPPEFSQFGGVIPIGSPLFLTSDQGAVYYTTDGSDPRLPGGAANPSARKTAEPEEVVLFDENSLGWTYLAGTTALSTSEIVSGNPAYGPSDWKHPNYNDSNWAPNPITSPNGAQGPLVGTGATSVNAITANTIIDIGPTGSRYATVYFRKDFVVSDAKEFSSIKFTSYRDDAMIVYLNGHEIYRDSFNANPVTYSDLAASAADENTAIVHTFDLLPELLIEGTNTIAIEVHNYTAGSSDLGLSFALSALKIDSGDALILTETGTVHSRVWNGAEWSALRSAEFIVGTPATSENLVISELMYNPQGADENLEFIELLNISFTETIDLTNVSFIDGILYTFPTGLVIPPLGRVVIAKDREAFIAHYGQDQIVLAEGSYSSSLSNGGESISLVDNQGDLIQTVSYSDNEALGWPSDADGLGASLSLTNELNQPSPNLASSWQASSIQGGTPGSPDQLKPSDPWSDLDGDGFHALAEYFFGTSDRSPSLNPLKITSEADELTLSFSMNPFLTTMTWHIEESSDLLTWEPATVQLKTPTLLPNGRLGQRAQVAASETKTYYRVKIIEDVE